MMMAFRPDGPATQPKPNRMNFKIEITSHAHRYGSVGHCIYCGSTRGLTDEHIVPLSLGGNWVLPKSTCVACTAATRSFEREMARNFLWPMRSQMKFPSRRNEWPTKFPVHFIFEDDSEERVLVPLNRFPTELFLMKFSACALFSGEACEDDTRHILPWRYGPPWWTIQEVLKPYELAATRRTGKTVKGVNVSEMHPWPLSQLLAKIATAFAYAEAGALGFTPLVTEVVRFNVRKDANLGAQSAMQKFVGGSQEVFEEHDSELHSLSLDIVEVAKVKYLVANIWLFALFGGAKYHVIVGQVGEGASLSVPIRRSIHTAPVGLSEAALI